ncbi:MAG: outer membrane protein [Alphaproteobacteria bacterium]
MLIFLKHKSCIASHILSAVIIMGALLTASAQSFAKDTSKLYISGYMGINLGRDLDFSEDTNTISGTADINNAPSFAGALGLRLSKNLRTEAELSYRKNDIDSLSGNFGRSDIGGDLSGWLGLINLYYDFDLDWKIKPYLSAGLGLGYYDADVVSLNGARFSDDAYGFTWQAGAGLQYRSGDKWFWTAGYRYLDSADLEFGDLDLDYNSHEIRLGVSYDLDWQ